MMYVVFLSIGDVQHRSVSIYLELKSLTVSNCFWGIVLNIDGLVLVVYIYAIIFVIERAFRMNNYTNLLLKILLLNSQVCM